MISDPTGDGKRRSQVQSDRVVQRVYLEETARLDECEITEFLRVAKEFPEFFPPAK